MLSTIYNLKQVYNSGISQMQEKNLPFVKNILLQLSKHVGAKGIRGLAQYLEVPDSNLYSWIARGSIGDPSAILKKIPNARIEWLESGKGEMLSEPPHPAAGKEPERQYGGYIDAVAAMMKEMDEETQKDVFLSVQKEKLLRELLRERRELEKKAV